MSTLNTHNLPAPITLKKHMNDASQKLKVVIHGGGNMGRAILNGVINSNKIDADIVLLVRETTDVPDNILNTPNIRIHRNIRDAQNDLKNTHMYIPASKPQDAEKLMSSLRGILSPDALVLSPMAGITAEFLQKIFGENQPTGRFMPNLPCHIGLGMTGYWLDHNIDENIKQSAVAIINTLGNNIDAKQEQMMDAVTAVSGSGPGYYFYFVEKMAQDFNVAEYDVAIILDHLISKAQEHESTHDISQYPTKLVKKLSIHLDYFSNAMKKGAQDVGFSEQKSRTLVNTTLYGASQTLTQSPLSASEWRKKVTSKNGTTEAGLKVMMNPPKKLNSYDDFYNAIPVGIIAARDRGRKLGKEATQRLQSDNEETYKSVASKNLEQN